MMEVGKWDGVRFIKDRAAAWAAAWTALLARQTAGVITTTIRAHRVRQSTETRHGSRSGTVAAAKRAALKAKRRKAHKARCR